MNLKYFKGQLYVDNQKMPVEEALIKYPNGENEINNYISNAKKLEQLEFIKLVKEIETRQHGNVTIYSIQSLFNTLASFSDEILTDPKSEAEKYILQHYGISHPNWEQGTFLINGQIVSPQDFLMCESYLTGEEYYVDESSNSLGISQLQTYILKRNSTVQRIINTYSK